MLWSSFYHKMSIEYSLNYISAVFKQASSLLEVESRLTILWNELSGLKYTLISKVVRVSLSLIDLSSVQLGFTSSVTSEKVNLFISGGGWVRWFLKRTLRESSKNFDFWLQLWLLFSTCFELCFEITLIFFKRKIKGKNHANSGKWSVRDI